MGLHAVFVFGHSAMSQSMCEIVNYYIYLFIYLFIYWFYFIYLFIYLFRFLCMYLFIHLLIYLLKYDADFRNMILFCCNKFNNFAINAIVATLVKYTRVIHKRQYF